MENKDYKLGLVSVSFRKHTPREILDAVKAAGLSCIEWGSDVRAPCTDISRLGEIAELQREYGIECSSYGTYFRLGETPIDQLEQYISAAKILGTDILRLWCGKRSGADMSDVERGELLSDCVKAAKIAEESGVTLCMECHTKTFTQYLDDALELMRTVNSPCFKMYWQPFQWQSIEENLAYAEAIAPYTRHIHVFQWKDKGHLEKFPLADGIEEWREYLTKFSVPRTLLLEFMPDDKLSTLKTEAATLRAIIGEQT